MNTDPYKVFKNICFRDKKFEKQIVTHMDL